MYATITHPRGRGYFLIEDADLGGMWLAKVARRGENLVQYLKISAGYCVGCEDL